MSVTDDGEVAVLFGEWFAREGLDGLGGEVTVPQTQLLARAFIAGYTHGLYRNAERVSRAPEFSGDATPEGS